MKGIFTYLLVAVFLATSVRADQTIRSVQQALKDQGFYYGNITGEKSAETTAAIRRYQIRSGLQVTGEMNSETVQSLNPTGKSIASSQPGSKPVGTQPNTARPDQGTAVEQNLWQHSSATPDPERETNPAVSGRSAPVRIKKRMVVADVQRQLITRGYYGGRVDGRYGRQTKFAVREFQFASGLPPTGRIDMSTLGTLGLSNANLAYLNPAPRSRAVWVPMTKFKHGKWKVKWKKAHPGDLDQYANEGRDNGYDADSREGEDGDE